MAKTMKISQSSSGFILEIPLITHGKFRCKNRNGINSYGVSFGSRTKPMGENSYLEWQIGYDANISNQQKESILNRKELYFIGANGKTKYPYELSEILYYLCKNNLIVENELLNLIDIVKSSNFYIIDVYKINISKEDNITLNKTNFMSSSIKLPTFMYETPNNILIEIVIEKQQYASGVQPMLYLDIPVTTFLNRNEIIGYTSSKTNFGKLELNADIKKTIISAFKCFGMLTSSHKNDVLKILNKIHSYCFRK